MKYYSTNRLAPLATLEEAVVKGLAGDKGLYMPEKIKALPSSFFEKMKDMSFQEISYVVADAFFGEDVDAEIFTSCCLACLWVSYRWIEIQIERQLPILDRAFPYCYFRANVCHIVMYFVYCYCVSL